MRRVRADDSSRHSSRSEGGANDCLVSLARPSKWSTTFFSAVDRSWE